MATVVVLTPNIEQRPGGIAGTAAGIQRNQSALADHLIGPRIGDQRRDGAAHQRDESIAYAFIRRGGAEIGITYRNADPQADLVLGQGISAHSRAGNVRVRTQRASRAVVGMPLVLEGGRRRQAIGIGQIHGIHRHLLPLREQPTHSRPSAGRAVDRHLNIEGSAQGVGGEDTIKRVTHINE